MYMFMFVIREPDAFAEALARRGVDHVHLRGPCLQTNAYSITMISISITIAITVIMTINSINIIMIIS